MALMKREMPQNPREGMQGALKTANMRIALILIPLLGWLTVRLCTYLPGFKPVEYHTTYCPLITVEFSMSPQYYSRALTAMIETVAIDSICAALSLRWINKKYAGQH